MMLFTLSTIFLTITILFYLFVRFWSNKTEFSLQDGFVIGLFIYSIGVFTLNIASGFNELPLLQLGSFTSIALSTSLISYLVMASFSFSKNSNVVKLYNQSSKNNSKVVLPVVVILFLFNLGFTYLVYSRILQTHFGGVFALLDIRKTISSGEAGYFAPGLIKQLRDILSPAIIAYIFIFYRSKYRKTALYFLILSTLLAMVVGGQRMPILSLFLIIFVAYFIRNHIDNKKLSGLFKISILVVGGGVVFFLNVLLGRSDESYGAFTAIYFLVKGMFDRVFTTVPHENAEALGFLMKQDFPAFSIWTADLSILLPGTQKGISNEIHSLLGGSEAGNAVLGLPLDVYINAGYAGLVIVPFCSVLLLSILNELIVRLKSPFVYSSRLIVTIYLPFGYSFYLFLLNGGLFILSVVSLFLLLKGFRPQKCQ